MNNDQISLPIPKRQKIFAIRDEIVEYEPEYSEEEITKAAVDKFHEELRGQYGTTTATAITATQQTSEDDEDPRKMFLQKMEKALIEFHGITRVIELLKQKEHLSLLTCTRPSFPIKGIQLPGNQRIQIRQSSFQTSQEYFSNAYDNALKLVEQRRKFTSSCLSLRKKWRLVITSKLPSNSSSTYNITHRDEVAIDCSYSIAGDTMLLNNHYVLIPINDEKKQNLLSLHSEYYTLQFSLSHIQFGNICTETLWNIIHTNNNPLRQKFLSLNPSSLIHSTSEQQQFTQVLPEEIISWKCEVTQHDVSIRSFFATLVAIERESRLLNTSSVLYDIWSTTSSHFSTTSDLSLPSPPKLLSLSSILSTLLSEPFTSSIHVVIHTRSQITLSLSSSINLTLSQVPLFQSSSQYNTDISFPKENQILYSLITPQSNPSSLFQSMSNNSNNINNIIHESLASHALISMLSCVGLSIQHKLFSSQKQQHNGSSSSLPSSNLNSSIHSIQPASSLLSQFIPLTHEHHWNEFLNSQSTQKQKQTPKYHYSYRELLLISKEISQTHLSFYRFMNTLLTTSSTSSYSNLLNFNISQFQTSISLIQLLLQKNNTTLLLTIPSRGVTIFFVPLSSAQSTFYLTSQITLRVHIEPGHWKHHSLQQILTIKIFPTYFEVISSPTSSSSSSSLSSTSSSFKEMKFLSSSLLIPNPNQVNERIKKNNHEVNLWLKRFESCEFVWEYIINNTQ